MLPGLSSRAAEQRGRDEAPCPPLMTLSGWKAFVRAIWSTWDPHPKTRHGGPILAIKTSAEGVQISHLLPQMADQMQHLNLIRSLVSKKGDDERGTDFVPRYRILPIRPSFIRHSVRFWCARCQIRKCKSHSMSPWRRAKALWSPEGAIWR